MRPIIRYSFDAISNFVALSLFILPLRMSDFIAAMWIYYHLFLCFVNRLDSKNVADNKSTHTRNRNRYSESHKNRFLNASMSIHHMNCNSRITVWKTQTACEREKKEIWEWKKWKNDQKKKNEKINLSYDKTNKKILSIEIHNYDSMIEYNLSNKIDFER